MLRTRRRVGLERLAGVLAAVVVALCVLTGAAFAQPGAADRTQQLVTESARLRSELEQTNAQISSLKQAGPGVRNDYRLRKRQADAEALARQLTTVEAELRRRRGPAPARPPLPASQELAEAPAALEARADLLTDEARRLTQQASGLVRAAGELRNRQTLLRRGSQIERDPFASMDTSKRFMVLQGAGRPENTNGRGGAPVNPPVVPPQPQPVPGNPSPPPATFTGPAQPGQTGQPGQAPEVVTTSAPSDARNSGAPTTRALLDPGVAAELGRIERATGKPLSEIERLDRAASALSTRARSLEAEAQALRSRAAKR